MMDWLDVTLSAENAARVLTYLADLTLKGLLLLSVAGIVAGLLRRASAATRHLIWSVALCSLLVLPVLSVVAPAWHVPLLPVHSVGIPPAQEVPGVPVAPVVPTAPVAPTAPAAPVPPAPGAATAAGAPVPPAVAVPPGETPVGAEDAAGPVVGWASNAFVDGLVALARAWGRMHWTTWLMLVWLAGLATILTQLTVGALGVWRLSRSARPVTAPEWLDLADEVGDRFFLRRPVRILKSSRTATPMTWGILRPVVLLPADADTWDEDRRRCVLTHEFAHIRRWDCLTQLLAQVASAVYWFNPLVWTGLRHLRTEREKACDDAVLVHGARASSYATHLLEIARTVRSPLVSPFGAVAMARPSQLEGRVLAILDGERERHALDARAAVRSLVVAACLILPFGTVRFWTPAPEGTPPAVALAGVPAPEALLPPAPYAGSDVAPVADVRVRALVEALRDTDAQVRLSAAHTLGTIEDPAAVDALGRTLGEDTDGDVRMQAAWALGAIEDARAVEILSQALLHDRDADVRTQAAWALGTIESADGLEALMKALKDASADVRQMAAWAVGNIDVEAPASEVPWRHAEPAPVARASGGAAVVHGAPGAARHAGSDAEAAPDVALGRFVGQVTAGVLGALSESADDALSEAARGSDERVDELIQRKIFDIRDEDIAALKALGYEDLTIDHLVAAKIHGVTPAFIQALRALGYQPSIDELVELRVIGVDPAYIEEMGSVGYRHLSTDELVELRVHAVDAAYVRDLEAAGILHPDVDQLVQLRILDVDPDDY